MAALAATIAVAGAAALAMRFVMHGEPLAATSRPSSGALTPRAPSATTSIPGGEFIMGATHGDEHPERAPGAIACARRRVTWM